VGYSTTSKAQHDLRKHLNIIVLSRSRRTQSGVVSRSTEEVVVVGVDELRRRKATRGGKFRGLRWVFVSALALHTPNSPRGPRRFLLFTHIHKIVNA
jgi:hypothetical protein